MLRSSFSRLADLWRAGRLTIWADVLLVVFLTVTAVALTGERGDIPAPPAMILWPDPPDVPAGVWFVAGESPSKPEILALNLVLVLPLLCRRRWPLICFAIQFTGMIALDVEGNLANLAALLIGAYSLAVHGRSVWLSMGALLTACGIVAANDSNTWPSLPGWTGVFVILVPIGLLGVAIRAARSRALASEQRAHALEREQQAATRLAVAEERARIARELHDVVSHHVSVMTIQAGAAGKVLDAHPDMARGALSAIEASGRETMAELRHLLGVLAPGPGDDLLHPQPGLDQLSALVENVRKAGLPVTLAETAQPPAEPVMLTTTRHPGQRLTNTNTAHPPAQPEAVTGARRPPRPPPSRRATTRPAHRPVTSGPGPGGLPRGINLAAYRVVQEALTNALRHAPGAETEVSVTVEPSATGKALVVTVINEAPPPHARPAASTGAGSGLLGLAERLRLYDGTLEAGRRVGGGFQVCARIPLPHDTTGQSETGPTGAPRPTSATGAEQVTGPTDTSPEQATGTSPGQATDPTGTSPGQATDPTGTNPEQATDPTDISGAEHATDPTGATTADESARPKEATG